MKPLLEVHNLSVRFQKGPPVVRNVSLTLNPSECLGIVGESGCGKSAFAKAIGSLHDLKKTHLEGSIRLEAEELLGAKEQRLRELRKEKIGYIFQDPFSSLNPSMRIGKQLQEVKGTSEESLLEMLEIVGIANPKSRLNDYPHMLSGGQRQRLIIAMALLRNPRLVIADEPTTALDATIQAQVLTLLKDLQKKLSLSLILISHDLRVVASLCSRVLVMYAGEIVEEAKTEELFANPKHPYTQKLLAATPIIGRTLETLKGTPPDFQNLPKGCSFAPRCEFVMPHCLTNRPEAFQISENRCCRCFLYEEKK